ncbi:MAG: hypothetical protein JSR99_13640 [Proteobacteria bacterium]|nr:hypothetical protein [Pseudomonadota bacterium]
MNFTTERYDTNNNFAAGRFTPTIPGKYLISLNVGATAGAAAKYVLAQISKNGVGYKQSDVWASGASEAITAHVTAIVDMNGTTDYIEGTGETNVTTGFAGDVGRTNMEGILISMAGGGSGGTATPAGSTNDVQFNSGGLLAADTGNFTYAGSILHAPSILTGGITATGQASLTTVSSTMVQLISNTTTACTSFLAGAQRYNGVDVLEQRVSAAH